MSQKTFYSLSFIAQQWDFETDKELRGHLRAAPFKSTVPENHLCLWVERVSDRCNQYIVWWREKEPEILLPLGYEFDLSDSLRVKVKNSRIWEDENLHIKLIKVPPLPPSKTTPVYVSMR